MANRSVAKENTMTVREIAETLGVSKDVVLNCIKRIFPKKMAHGKTTYLNSYEIAIISKELKSNNKVLERLTVEAASTVKNSTTEIEIIANYKAAAEAMTNLLQMKLQKAEADKEYLEIKLDESKKWYSVKRMEKLNPDKHFDWRLLKKEAERLEIEIKKVFDQNYGEVNAYHRKVWESLYFDALNYGD